MNSSVQNFIDSGLSWNREFVRRAIFVILGLVAGITVMWFLNVLGLKWVNLIFFFLGTFIILIVGFMPAAIGLSALTGSIVRGATRSEERRVGKVCGTGWLS